MEDGYAAVITRWGDDTTELKFQSGCDSGAKGCDPGCFSRIFVASGPRPQTVS
jgi:hypothetical protein